jgi:hypothetical protein
VDPFTLEKYTPTIKGYGSALWRYLVGEATLRARSRKEKPMVMGFRLPYYGFLALLAIIAAGGLVLLSSQPNIETLADLDGPEPPGIVVVPVADDFNLPQFLRLICTQKLPLHVAPVSRDREDLSQGFYLTDRDWPWEQLNALPREIGAASRWTGVVIVDHRNKPFPYVPEIVATWGRHGLMAGQLLMFGDPEILAQIRHLLQDQAPSAK